ncbi:glycerol-3-phosphate dehydrogenase subunit GlpB [Halobaculum gomorrense]|uniref:Glycerol 3-phosphate dehydrogenase (Quinone) subunit B n=1 Tax=Halobaculum gomorrense TaxID=43928 RepID=A0A1M5UC52_9EURY|nr:glycerol-3-phosphate dehydrogenase subunit GlpB [Halobaculum gomorrense]SHH60416.1 glycerol 3-phosphate dehydrogenase (quinone) subunit B [Halobaculum gomorrense]
MAIESDVVVIGGGLAGATAALSAAREGVHVHLVSANESTLRQASGLIDALGYAVGHAAENDGEDAGAGSGDADAVPGPLADPFAVIEDLPADHPYRVAGADALREGLALFDDAVGDLYRGGHTDRNALVPTTSGRAKPTARYPQSVAPGLASDGRPMLLVGFEADTEFDAPLAAERLSAAGVPFDVSGATVEFAGEYRADAAVTRLAHALERDESAASGRGTTAGEGRTTRQRLADRIRPHLGDAERVGIPAMLGDSHVEEVRADLSERLDAEVFEVPTGPPSLPGIRLEDRLFDALDSAGVSMTTGTPVVDFETGADGRVASVTIDRNGARIPYEAGAFVLATGGLVGKGLDSDRERAHEALFGCHVPQPDDRMAWSAGGAFADHAFARFGVRPDDRMRPLDVEGTPEYANLAAAGGVVGGADVAREKSASGVSLATGLVAGRTAAEEA